MTVILLFLLGLVGLVVLIGLGIQRHRRFRAGALAEFESCVDPVLLARERETSARLEAARAQEGSLARRMEKVARRDLKRVRRYIRQVEKVAEHEARHSEREAYLDGLSFPTLYQLIIIFTVASIGGLILETIWVRFAMGIWQSRVGLVWGPFSPLYGVGAVILTVALWKLRKRPMWVVFLVSMVLGSLLEQLTGVILDEVFGATSWTYESYPDAITKYVSVRMSVIWGMLGWAWCKACMPEFIYLIGEPKRRGELVLVAFLTAFLVLDVAMTVAVTMRKNARDAGIPATNVIEEYIDARYDDTFMETRFENVEFESVTFETFEDIMRTVPDRSRSASSSATGDGEASPAAGDGEASTGDKSDEAGDAPATG